MKLFKNLTLYNFKGDISLSSDLYQQTLHDPIYDEIVATGFVAGFGNEFKFGIATKVLPPSLVKKLLNEKIKEELAASGRKRIDKVRKQELKEAVISNLLKTALVKYDYIDGYFDGQYLLINSPSVKNCYLIIEKLIKNADGSLTGLQIEPIGAVNSPQQVLATALLGDNQLDDLLVITDNVALYDLDTPGTTIKVSSHEMTEDILLHVRNGLQVASISLCMNERLKFVLTKNLQVKSIKFTDLCFPEDSDKDADYLIQQEEFRRLISALDKSFGLLK